MDTTGPWQTPLKAVELSLQRKKKTKKKTRDLTLGSCCPLLLRCNTAMTNFKTPQFLN